MKSKESKKPLSIASPLSGRSVSLDQVPDEVFSGRILGDGCAVIPSDNKIYSPVDGTISSTVETKHAYGFSSDDAAVPRTSHMAGECSAGNRRDAVRQ